MVLLIARVLICLPIVSNTCWSIVVRMDDICGFDWSVMTVIFCWTWSFNRPFEKPAEASDEQPEHPLLGVDRHFRIAGELQRAFPDLPMVGAGYSWLQRFMIHAAARNIENGSIRIFGAGRCAIAYPDFAQDALDKGELDELRVCKTLSFCSYLMRRKKHPLGQFPTGCPPFDKLVYGPIIKDARERRRR